MKALLVEDEGFTREGLVLLIGSVMPELEIVSVGSLADAEKELAKGIFSFIFLDIELREARSGLDFLGDLKDRGIATPVIMLSNQDSQEIVLESVRRGAFGFLPKQTEQRAIIRHAVDVVLRGGVYLPHSVHVSGGMKSPPRRAPAVANMREVSAFDLGLTRRVYEATYWAAHGLKNKEIAKKMNGISDNVVAEYLQKAYEKLEVGNRVELITMLNRRAIHLLPPMSAAADAHC